MDRRYKPIYPGDKFKNLTVLRESEKIKSDFSNKKFIFLLLAPRL